MVGGRVFDVHGLPVGYWGHRVVGQVGDFSYAAGVVPGAEVVWVY